MMRKLDRSAVPAPAGLAKYQHGRHRWEDVEPEDKAEIRASLATLQGEWCAYCERRVAQGSAHIEHFIQRDFVPGGAALTFQWSNLFWSCLQDNHCGRHKDKPGVSNSYDRPTLLKPDVDDGRRFLRFRDGGAVEPRPGLSPTDATRASETIRVFNLNEPNLVAERRALLKPLIDGGEFAAALAIADEDPALARSALDDLAEIWACGAFRSAVLDCLRAP